MPDQTTSMLRNLLSHELKRDEGVLKVGRALSGAGVEQAFLVGGIVRDAAMGLKKPNIDYDIALPAFAPSTAAAVARNLGGTAFLLDQETGAWRVIAPGDATVDLIPYRGEDIEGDLRGRDFTLNAVAFDLIGQRGVIDPLDGLDALGKRTLRLCSVHALDEDPLRVLRAYRFAAVYDFDLDPGLPAFLASGAKKLTEVSGERIRYELFRLFAGPHAAKAVRRAVADTTWEVVFPFILRWRGFDQGNYHAHDLLEHSLLCVDHAARVVESPHFGPVREKLEAHLAERVEADVTRLGLLRFTAFFHDIGKPMTLTIERGGRRRFIGHDLEGAKLITRILAKFKVGKRAARASARVAGAHLRLFGLAHQAVPTRRSRLRYLRDMEEEAPEAVLLALADELATGERDPAEREALFATGAEILDLFFNAEEPVEPLIRGRDLREAFGMEEGPIIGMVLAAVADAESAGKVTDREGALAYAKVLVERLGGR